MVFKKKIDDKFMVIKKNISSFQLPYDSKEKEYIANIYKGNREIDLFNGINVRLENIYDDEENTIFVISKIEFFDFIATNMLFINHEKWKNGASIERMNILNKGVKKLNEDGWPNDFFDIISRNYISNILAVSVLIRDKEENYLLVKRNYNVAISRGMMSVSVTGSLDGEDYDEINPIISCVVRETKEELGLILENNQVHVNMIVAGEKKLQPIVLCDVVVEQNLHHFVENINMDRFLKENIEFVIVKKNKLSCILNEYTFTEAASEHIQLNIGIVKDI